MLSYLVLRELEKTWSGLNVTMEEGLASLASLCAMTLAYASDGTEVQKKGSSH